MGDEVNPAENDKHHTAEGGDWMQPIEPMEPVSSDTVPEGGQWVAQVKWDGVRMLTYFDGTHVELYNRKLRPRTFHYPELNPVRTYCAADSVILDGEVIALGADGKPDFHQVMKRDGLRRMERVKQVAKGVPIHYMIFDILYLNGEWIHHQPFRERSARLSEVITPNEHVQLVSSHHDAAALFQVVKSHGMEGIVAKQLESQYYLGEKRDVWRKIKNYRDLVAVVGGFTLNDAGVVNALLLGLYDNHGRLVYIGHSGTGKLSHSDWRHLTDVLKPHVTDVRPFVNTPERHRDAFWVAPLLTVKIQYAEWTEGRSLRQPSIQSIVQVPPEDCVFEPGMMRHRPH